MNKGRQLRAPTADLPPPIHAISSSHTSSQSPEPFQPARPRRRIGLHDQINAPIRKHPWKSKKRWTRSELTRERDEFFDTRVTGREEIWAVLKAVVGLLAEDDIPNAQSMLDAAAITVPTGDLINGAYDQRGSLYTIPEHIINDPDNVVIDAQDEFMKREDSADDTDGDEAERRREEKGKGVIKNEDMISIKARLSDRGGPDITVSIGKDQNVRTFVRRVREEANVRGAMSLISHFC